MLQNIAHKFSDINNMILVKHIPYKGTIMNTLENLHKFWGMYITHNKLISEEIQT